MCGHLRSPLNGLNSATGSKNMIFVKLISVWTFSPAGRTCPSLWFKAIVALPALTLLFTCNSPSPLLGRVSGGAGTRPARSRLPAMGTTNGGRNPFTRRRLAAAPPLCRPAALWRERGEQEGPSSESAGPSLPLIGADVDRMAELAGERRAALVVGQVVRVGTLVDARAALLQRVRRRRPAVIRQRG